MPRAGGELVEGGARPDEEEGGRGHTYMYIIYDTCIIIIYTELSMQLYTAHHKRMYMYNHVYVVCMVYTTMG